MPSLSGGFSFFIMASKKAMLLASAHILLPIMIRQLKPFLLSRRVCIFPSLSKRTTPAPWAIPFGAADRAWAVYWASEEPAFLAAAFSSARESVATARSETANIVGTRRIGSPSSLSKLGLHFGQGALYAIPATAAMRQGVRHRAGAGRRAAPYTGGRHRAADRRAAPTPGARHCHFDLAVFWPLRSFPAQVRWTAGHSISRPRRNVVSPVTRLVKSYTTSPLFLSSETPARPNPPARSWRSWRCACCLAKSPRRRRPRAERAARPPSPWAGPALHRTRRRRH